MNLTASLFYGLADAWWQTVRAPYQIMPEDIVWTTFKVQIADKYILAHIKWQKRAECQKLKQGSMTVLEYVTKFERLSKYTADMIDTELKKINHFIEGLNPVLKRDVIGVFPPATFDEAYTFEEINNEITRDRKQQYQQQN